MKERTFDAIGTVWTIGLPKELSEAEGDAIFERIHTRIDAFDQNYSRFRPDSLVTRMSQAAGMYTLPDDAKPLFDLYQELYALTDGAVTPLIGNALSDAGYDATYSFQPQAPSAPAAWDTVMSYDYPTLTLHQPVLLDVGAAGKGYLVDLIAELLRTEAGLTSFFIDAGGDIRVEGNTLEIGLEHPNDETQAIGIATITNKSMCGSSGARRTWGPYHHILDPRSLSSPRHILAVWAVAESTMLADALTTALYFVEPARLASLGHFEYLILAPDFTTTASPGFPATLFTH